MLFGLAARILLGALAVGAVAAIVIVINGMITRSKLRDALRSKGVEDAIIKEINNCDNTITLEELNSDKKVEVRGDDIDYDLDEGDIIYV